MVKIIIVLNIDVSFSDISTKLKDIMERLRDYDEFFQYVKITEDDIIDD